MKQDAKLATEVPERAVEVSQMIQVEKLVVVPPAQTVMHVTLKDETAEVPQSRLAERIVDASSTLYQEDADEMPHVRVMDVERVRLFIEVCESMESRSPFEMMIMKLARGCTDEL